MTSRKQMRRKRQNRIRSVVLGTSTRPRLSVFRSGQALCVQIIDDGAGKTLLSKQSEGKNAAAASTLGKEIAVLSKTKKITSVVFDRGGNRYHGVIKALADAAREGGLQF